MTVPGKSLVASEEIQTEDFSGTLYQPFGPPPHAGVLILHGSDPTSEFPDEYARLLSLHGYAALRLTYFGTASTPETLTEVPLRQFDAATEWLLQSEWVQQEKIGLVAWSRGTEAAFLAADRNDQIGALVGYEPSAYVFPGFPPSEPTRSAWSVDGEPVPFVPPYEGIEDDEDEPGVVRFKRTVERASDEQVDQAALPVDNIEGPVLLVSGTDDRVWPSAQFGDTLAERLSDRGHQSTCTNLTYEEAGHAITVPYETMPEDILEEMGGSVNGTAHAAIDAWEQALSTLRKGLN